MDAIALLNSHLYLCTVCIVIVLRQCWFWGPVGVISKLLLWSVWLGQFECLIRLPDWKGGGLGALDCMLDMLNFNWEPDAR